MFNRTVRGKRPLLKKRNIVNRQKTAKKNETTKQKYNKEYANNNRNVKSSSIKIGDYVVVRQDKQNKLTPNFNKTPYVVTHKTHSSYNVFESDEEMQVNPPETFIGEMYSPAEGGDKDIGVYGKESMEICCVKSDSTIEVQHGPAINDERYRRLKEKLKANLPSISDVKKEH